MGWEGREHDAGAEYSGGGVGETGSDWLDSCIPFVLHITQVIELDYYHHLNDVNKKFQARNITDLINNSNPAYSKTLK